MPTSLPGRSCAIDGDSPKPFTCQRTGMPYSSRDRVPACSTRLAHFRQPAGQPAGSRTKACPENARIALRWGRLMKPATRADAVAPAGSRRSPPALPVPGARTKPSGCCPLRCGLRSACPAGTQKQFGNGFRRQAKGALTRKPEKRSGHKGSLEHGNGRRDVNVRAKDTFICAALQDRREYLGEFSPAAE